MAAGSIPGMVIIHFSMDTLRNEQPRQPEKLHLEEAREMVRIPCRVRQVMERDDIVCIQLPFMDVEGNPILVFAGYAPDGEGFIVDDGGLVLAGMTIRGMDIMGWGMRRLRTLLTKGAREDIMVKADHLGREWLERKVDSLSGAAFHDFILVLCIYANATQEWVRVKDRARPDTSNAPHWEDIPMPKELEEMEDEQKEQPGGWRTIEPGGKRERLANEWLAKRIANLREQQRKNDIWTRLF